MKIEIKRFVSTSQCTIGRLSIEGEPLYYTIEKPWVNNQAYISCIPKNSYRMVRYDSPSFGPNTWIVRAVPDRSYILFHVANVADNVQGCIGLGTSVYENLTGVKNSRVAVDEFHRKTRDEDMMELNIIEGVICD